MLANGRDGHERGAGQLKAIVWLAILGVFVYVCIKVVPILYNEYQFQDAMQSTARFATINRQSPDDIRKTMVQEAQAKAIPVQPENIHITADGGNVKISADYTIIVDLQVYQLTLNLHPSASNNAL
jgi:predicted membrane protein